MVEGIAAILADCRRQRLAREAAGRPYSGMHRYEQAGYAGRAGR